MADPVFSSSDRVENNELPEALKGKSPAEIAAFYQDRERQIINRANNAIAAAAANGGGAPPPTPPQPGPKVQMTKEEWWNDPDAAARKLLSEQGVSRTEFNSLTATAQRVLIASAENLAKADKPDWGRYAVQIQQIMAKMAQSEQIDPETWNTVYYNIRGMNADKLIQESVEATRKQFTEPVQPAGTPPAAPRDLNAAELKVVDGLDITPEMYTEGAERIEKGVWPLTTDNRKKNR